MTESLVCNNVILDVISNAKKGDENAYSYLIDLLNPTLLYMSKKYFIPKWEKEDLYQVALVGLHKGVLSFNYSRSSSPIDFLKMCIRREIFSSIKTSTRQKHIHLNNSISMNVIRRGRNNQEYTLADTLSTDFDFVDNILIAKESIKNIQNHIDSLTKLEKEIMSLYISGFTPLEISSSLNKTTKQIDNALQRAKRKLKLLIASN